MTVSLRDGMGGEELGQVGSQVSSSWITGSFIAEDKISGLNLYATGSVQAGKVIDNSQRVAVLGTGSPSTWGLIGQVGSDALSAGSSKWVTFGTAFGGAPDVSVTNLTTVANDGLAVIAGSIVAGSFYVEGQTASDVFSWMAVGTRA